jgi:hypothetical protein
LDSSTTIHVDATRRGHGGAVAIWSDGATDAQGAISAQGGSRGGDGGIVETSGHSVDFVGLAVDTSARFGKSGLWLVDPTNLTIDAASASTISGNLVNSDVLLQTNSDGTTSGPGVASVGAGDIIVNSGVSWASNHTLTLSAFNAIAINAPLTISGAGALVLNAAMDTTTAPAASLLKLSFGSAGGVNFTGAEGSGQSLKINGAPYTLVYSMAELDAIDGTSAVNGSVVTPYGPGLGGAYALASNLTASTSYTSALIGLGTLAPFSGVLEGLGHTITGLTINDPE